MVCRRGIVALAFGIVGCSLASLDGLSGGAVPAPAPPDANADAETDARTDAPVAPPSDGGANDADAKAFSCAALTPKPVLCAQFDDPALVTGWDDLRVADGGQAVIDPTFAVSPPSSLRVSVAAAMLDPPFAYLIRNAAAPTRQLSASFDVRMAALDPAQLTYAQLSTGAYYLNMVVSASQAFMQQAYPKADKSYQFDNIPMTVGIGAGQWAHVAVTIDFESDGGAVAASSLSVSVNGAKAIDRAPLEAHRFLGPTYFALGAYFRTLPSGAWTTWYDDAVFDVK